MVTTMVDQAVQVVVTQHQIVVVQHLMQVHNQLNQEIQVIMDLEIQVQLILHQTQLAAVAVQVQPEQIILLHKLAVQAV
tara:strand:+ start:192 stop:428 length:237 start_codon:yes stop_codon:yes gene_type:complete